MNGALVEVGKGGISVADLEQYPEYVPWAFYLLGAARQELTQSGFGGIAPQVFSWMEGTMREQAREIVPVAREFRPLLKPEYYMPGTRISTKPAIEIETRRGEEMVIQPVEFGSLKQARVRNVERVVASRTGMHVEVPAMPDVDPFWVAVKNIELSRGLVQAYVGLTNQFLRGEGVNRELRGSNVQDQLGVLKSYFRQMVAGVNRVAEHLPTVPRPLVASLLIDWIGVAVGPLVRTVEASAKRANYELPGIE